MIEYMQYTSATAFVGIYAMIRLGFEPNSNLSDFVFIFLFWGSVLIFVITTLMRSYNAAMSII